MTCQHVYVGPRPHEMEDGISARRCRECGWRERVIRLPWIPPGSNQLHRMHHEEVARLRRQLHQDVSYLLLEAGPVGDPLERARVTCDFRWRDGRRRDADNYLAGLKAGLDALVGRWLVDDDVDHVEQLARGRTGTGEPDHVVITVEPRP